MELFLEACWGTSSICFERGLVGVAAGCNTGASCVSGSEGRQVPRTSWWQLALVTKFAVLDSTGKLERTAAGQLAPLDGAIPGSVLGHIINLP